MSPVNFSVIAPVSFSKLSFTIPFNNSFFQAVSCSSTIFAVVFRACFSVAETRNFLIESKLKLDRLIE